MHLPSDTIKKGMARAGARSMWKATGLTDADLDKPLVAVCHTWTDVTPCSINQRHLAEKVKEGVRAAGGTPIEFNSITVTDGIAMGTEGMKASLISREIVTDSFELATSPLVIVVGSEGRGLARLTLTVCDVTVFIPMARAVESLNASVAAGVVLAEVARRRRVEAAG